jgi:ABC-2 type transport system permease protein
MTQFLIKLVTLFRKLYEASGVDFEQLIAIVRVKLLTDNRRQNAAMTQGSRKKKDPTNRFLMVMLAYVFMGGFMTMYIAFMDSAMLAASVLHTIAMVMLAMTLITDYSSILLDTTDSMILLPRPIDGRTLFAARLTHITLYIGQIVLAFSLIPCIVFTTKFDFFVGFIFFISLVFNALFALFLTSVIYLLLMRFTSEERIKDVLNYLQIVVAVCIFAFYQIMPRIFNIKDVRETQFEPAWWNPFVPPMWFGSMVDTAATYLFDGYHLGLIALGLVVPLGGLWWMNRSFSTVFTQKLSGMSMDVKTNSAEGGPSVFLAKNDLSSRFAGWFTSNPIESGVFQLVWRQVTRDRKIRLRIYPQYAYVLVMIVVIMWRSLDNEEGLAVAIEQIKDTRWYLFLIYFGSTILSAAMTLVPYSDDYKAAWVYYAMPIEKPGNALIGSLKAQFFKLFMPFYLFLSILILSLWGIKTLDDVVFGLCNIILLSLITAILMKPLLPFSEQGNAQEQSGGFIRSMLSVLAFGGFAGIHYLVTLLPYVITALIPFQLLAIYFLIKEYRNTPWEKVNIASI